MAGPDRPASRPAPGLAPAALREALAGVYRFERVVGRGGMATVYLAHDVRHARRVAVKVLHPELGARGDLPERFLREVRFSARLVHPHILPVHDSGRVDELLYAVMPYLEGESLAQRIRREGQLPVDEAVRITRAVASALDYAHRQGIVHRDIKPDNILLVEGHPVVADFGVARAVSDSRADDLTVVGAMVGTPAYMSPEQAGGDEVVDGRSDLYSLGCVLYEMLAGEPPFPHLPVQATLFRHLTQEAPRVAAARPTVPPVVDRVVARALAKRPEDRFATAAELADALGSAPVPPGPASVVSLGRDARALAVLPFRNVAGDPESEYLSDGIMDELTTALSRVEGLHVVSRSSVLAQLAREPPDVRALGAELNVSYVLEGTLRRAGSRLRVTAQLTDATDGRVLWSGRFDRQVEDVFAIEEELARTLVDTLRGLLVGDLAEPTPRRYTENPRAYHLYLKGRHAWNLRTHDGTVAGIRFFEEALTEDPDYALAHTGLADCYAMQTDYRGVPVRDGMERAKREAGQALALDEGLAEAHTSLAWVTFIYDWDWPAAEREFRRAIELNPRYATARQWYSWFLMAMGRQAEALTEARLAAALEPASMSIQRSLGWIHHMVGQYEEAAAQVRRAVVMDPGSDETYRIMGMVHLGGGRWADAEARFAEALAIAPESAYSLAGLGATHALAGRPELAADVIARLEDLAARRYVSPVAFAMVYAALADRDRTFHWIERAHAERRGWLAYLRVEPLLHAVRDDPRMADWLRRMRLA